MTARPHRGLDGSRRGHGRGVFPGPDAEDIDNAYVTVGDLLNNEYFITIANGFTDCAEHELEVTVNGETATATFTRRTCDTEPNAFSFESLTDLVPGTGATSNTVTISGIEVPAHISVIRRQILDRVQRYFHE